MSRWQEFGFPQVCGVPVQTLLEGLFLACAERAKIMGVYDETWDNLYERSFEKPCLYNFAVSTIENLIGGDYREYHLMRVTPDRKPLSLVELAAYLGEELINMPTTNSSLTGTLSCEWALQRYRMINASFLAVPVDYSPAFHYRTEFLDSGWQNSFNEAQKNLKNAETNVSGILLSASSQIHYDSIPEFRLARVCHVPDKITYFAAKPVTLKLMGTAYLADFFQHPNPFEFAVDRELESYVHTVKNGSEEEVGQWDFDDFGTGLPFKKETLLTEFLPPEEAAMNDVIDIPGLADSFFTKFSPPLPYSVSGNDGFCMTTRGMQADLTLLYDFSKHLEFYDPLENKGENN